jgi:uncharacterized repeat protein (TIGR04076 family)
MDENKPLADVNWAAFAQAMGYSDEELKVFRSQPNNEYVVRNAARLNRWWIVAEVIEAHGCAAGHKVGQTITFSAAQGTLEADKSPAHICMATLSALATAVAVYQERIVSGLDPDANLYRRLGCVDAGLQCGGWGHVSFKLYAVPRE